MLTGKSPMETESTIDSFFRKTKYFNVIVILILSFYFFIIPALQISHNLFDPGLRDGQIPRFTYGWHKSLSGKYAQWAERRVKSGKAAGLEKEDVMGTEWPVFGSVFYLWATEALQNAWELDKSLSSVAPKEYAKESIEAATALITDPEHAAWVKKYWGDDYLKRENLFYRMLLISGMTSYQKLTGDTKYQAFLSEQVESLAAELDASPHGLLDDYPAQCYPVDILPAIANIKRADSALGTDHSEMVARAIRGFEGESLDPETGLTAYNVSSRTGKGYGGARGVGLSFMLTWAPEIWPETAEDWYTKYENHFWQTGWLMSGFREFPKSNTQADWSFEVDAGPIVGGYGAAANAFGIGAARANGRMDQAYQLSAAALFISWPMPDGTLLVPRIMSNVSESPYLGESALLFGFTRTPQMSIGQEVYARKIPLLVFIGLGVMLVLGLVYILLTIRDIRNVPKRKKERYIPFPKAQLICLGFLYIAVIIIYIRIDLSSSIIVLLVAQLFPRTRKLKNANTVMDNNS